MKRTIKVEEDQLRNALLDKIAKPGSGGISQLRDIPKVMRSRLGWPVAAQLMDRWFNSPFFRMPVPMKFSQAPYRLSQLHPAHIDERIVTMRWALGFSRVRHSMAALQNGWATPAGLDELRAKVKRSASMCHRRPWRFGDLGLPAKILDDTCQTNIVGVGRISDPKDDFYGAIGRASLKVAVSGVVTHRPDGTSFITVDELGFYLRDSYEFNDNGSFISQFLGFWGFNGVDTMPQLRGQIQVEDTQSDLTEKELALLKYRVQNSDFDRWRQKHAAGGDFMLVSDVHRHRLPKPLAFQIS